MTDNKASTNYKPQTRNEKGINCNIQSAKLPFDRTLSSSSSVDRFNTLKQTLSVISFPFLSTRTICSPIETPKNLMISHSVKCLTRKASNNKTIQFGSPRKEEDLYKTIFHNRQKVFTEKKEIINNKYNIFYAENEQSYQRNLIKINKEKKNKGKSPVQDTFFVNKRVKQKMYRMKDSISFIKCIVDYAYPNLMTVKNKLSSNIKPDALLQSTPIYKQKDLQLKQKEHLKQQYLLSSFRVRKVQI